MIVKFNDVKEDNWYWVYTGEIKYPIDYVIVEAVDETQIDCSSETDNYYPGPYANFSFFTEELEARRFAAMKLHISITKNKEAIEKLENK